MKKYGKPTTPNVDEHPVLVEPVLDSKTGAVELESLDTMPAIPMDEVAAVVKPVEQPKAAEPKTASACDQLLELEVMVNGMPNLNGTDRDRLNEKIAKLKLAI